MVWAIAKSAQILRAQCKNHTTPGRDVHLLFEAKGPGTAQRAS